MRLTQWPLEGEQYDGERRVFPCDLDALAPLLDREGAAFGLVAGGPAADPGARGRSLVWHRPGDELAPADVDLLATSEGASTALALRVRPPAPGVDVGGGLFDSPARRHAFSLVAGALSSGVLAVGISLLMLGPGAPLLTLVLVGLTVGVVALVVLALWGLALLWGRVRAWRARARAARWRRAAGERLFAALERGLRRAGPYR